jgi:hypothetical protein
MYMMLGWLTQNLHVVRAMLGPSLEFVILGFIKKMVPAMEGDIPKCHLDVSTMFPTWRLVNPLLYNLRPYWRV